MIDLEEIAEAMYQNYIAEAHRAGTVTAKIEVVIDPLCEKYHVTRRQFGEMYLELVQMACLRGVIKYGMMLEVDATWSDMASWNRRKPQNQVFVFGRPVRIIEMRKKEAK